MAYQKGLRVKNWKFFVGTENFEANNSVPFDKFYYAENVRFKGKYLSSKNGYQKLCPALVGGTEFKGLFEYQYFDGNSILRKLIGIYNKQFYEFNTLTQVWDPITTVWPNIEDKPVSGIVYANSLYVIGQTNKKGNGVGKLISGYDYTFNVYGVTNTPALNNVYQQGGKQFIVTGSNIINGEGTVTTKKLLDNGSPNTPSVGTPANITCVAGTGGSNAIVVGNLTIVNGGTNYLYAPKITVTGGGGSGAQITATLTGGVITALTVVNGGTGYVTAPTITVDPSDELIFVGGNGASNTIVITTTSQTWVCPPTKGAIYSQGTNTYKVLTDPGKFPNYVGALTFTVLKIGSSVNPSSSGTLTYVSGGEGPWGPGQPTINYASFTTSVADAKLSYTGFTKSATITTTFNLISDSPEGTGIEAYAERLITIGDPSFVGMTVHSQPATSAADYFKVENFNVANGGAYFTAAKNSPLTAVRVVNDSLYYSGIDTLYQHTKDAILAGQNPVELSRTGGSINQNSFIVVENDIWFINKENQIRSLGNERNLGENPRTKALSEVILKYMDSLADVQTSPSASYLNRVVKIRLRTKNSTYNNFTIIFDYNTGGFSTDRGQGVGTEVIWNGYLIYAEANSGQCYYDELGYSADDAAIPVKAYTPFNDDSRPDTFKRTRYVYFKGKQSYTQPITLKVFYDGDYTKFETFTIPSPQSRGVTFKTPPQDALWGDSQVGDAIFGGNDGSTTGVEYFLYDTEELISLSLRTNLVAIGIEASCNGGKIVCEQLIVKVIDEPESYKRATI